MSKLVTIVTIFLLFVTYAYGGITSTGRQAVDTAGTKELLSATSTPCNTMISVTAFEANTDVVVVGNASIDATEATRNGLVLFAGQTEYIYGRSDLAATYVDSEVNAEGVSFNCYN